MTRHYPQLRRHGSPPRNQRLIQREVVRLVLHLPFDHHDLSAGVNRALDVYLRAVGQGPEILSEFYDMETDPFPLDDDNWKVIRDNLAPPIGKRFFDDIEDEKMLLRYEKNQFQRCIELTGGESGVSGYGFFYWSRLPWRSRTPDDDENSLLSFSWPTEYLEKHGPEHMRALVLELASLLPFSSGHAGLAFSSPNLYGASMQGIHEESFRYPGLDVAHGTRFLGAKVDGVHWLNLLGQPVLGQLGGVLGLRSRLHSPGTTVQELAGERAVVTLGPWPEAGDLSQGDNLPAYRELARVLEPWLYFPEPGYDFHDSTPEETLRWWRRFLD